MSALDRAVYAAAFVSAFDRLHDYGWRDTEQFPTIGEWEDNCALNAHDEAWSLVHFARRQQRRGDWLS